MKKEPTERETLVAFTLSSGSILNVVPAVSFGERVPRGPVNGRVHSDFQRVGTDLHQAFDKLGTEMAYERFASMP